MYVLLYRNKSLKYYLKKYFQEISLITNYKKRKEKKEHFKDILRK